MGVCDEVGVERWELRGGSCDARMSEAKGARGCAETPRKVGPAASGALGIDVAS